MRLDEARTILRKAHPELRSRFGVSSIAIFGSVARGEEHPDSDVDLIVEFEHSVSLFDLADLRRRLCELLGCRVDVGTLDALRPRAREQALREAVRVA